MLSCFSAILDISTRIHGADILPELQSEILNKDKHMCCFALTTYPWYSPLTRKYGSAVMDRKVGANWGYVGCRFCLHTYKEMKR